MKRVLIILNANLSVHGRALKEIMALKEDYFVDTIGTEPSGIDGIGFYKFCSDKNLTITEKALTALRIAVGNYKAYFASLKITEKIEGLESLVKPDVIIAHNAHGLFISNTICGIRGWKVPVVLNMHEYAPLQNASIKSKFLDKPFIWYLKKFGAEADTIYTVADGIARKYEEFLGLEKGAVRVTYNAPFYNEGLSPKRTGNTVRMVSHGLASKERKLEIMIETMKLLPHNKYTLDLYLVNSDPEYYEKLVKLSEKVKNVQICKPVKYDEITNMLNRYDLFFYSIFPTSFNRLYCLPNKFFEAIQGRLAIVIGPSPEMKRIIDEYDLGVVAKDFSSEALAESIKQLSPELIDNFKFNSDKNAYKLSAETAMETIRHIVKEIA